MWQKLPIGAQWRANRVGQVLKAKVARLPYHNYHIKLERFFDIVIMQIGIAGMNEIGYFFSGD